MGRDELSDFVWRATQSISSMHRDLESGDRLEARWRSGGVVALGRQVGVETPLDSAMDDILARQADGRKES